MRSRLSMFAGGVAACTAFAAAAPAQLQSAQQSPAVVGPAIQEFGSAYDEARDLTVMFGGIRLGFWRNEIYEWDGTNWVISPVFPRPGPRARPSVAWDGVNGKLLVFGGFTSASAFLSDTWSYDGPTFGQLSPATTPGARSSAATAYDPARQVVVMFGGFVASGNDAQDTWEWDGTDWTQAQPTNQPGPRGAHRMVYDASRQKVVMFGGWQTPASATLGDTWQYDGVDWTPVATTTSPPNRCDQAMVYDPRRGRTFMFGGLASVPSPGNPVTLGDSWVLGPNGWESKVVPGLPSTRTNPLGAYDILNEEIVLHTGFTSQAIFDDTYVVDTLTAADMTAYGVGCAGTSGVPDLAADSLPWLDDYYQVSVTNVPTSTAGFITLGLSNTIWNGLPIPVDLTSFGLAGCQAWLGPDFSALFLVQNGIGSWGVTVCNCPWAVGVSFSLQAVVLDPGAPNVLGASMSNALRATIGAW